MRLRTLPRAPLWAGALLLGACSLTHHLEDLQGNGADAGSGGASGGSAGSAGGGPSDSGNDAPGSPTPLLPLGALAAGGLHGCVIDGAGDVFCWGSNLNGQLGDGVLGGKRGKLGRVGLPEKAKSVACGGQHTCAVGVSGVAYCWGSGSAGQLGSGSSDSPTPIAVPGPSALVAVAAGANHTCAMSQSEVHCWGSNARGQLGVQTAAPSGPQLVPLAASALAAGALHSCALSAGKVHCWGANESGQLGEPGLSDQNQPHLVNITSGTPTRIAAGGRHSCAVLSDDSVLCWGSNAKGQLGLGTSGAAPVAPSAVPGIGALALGLGDSHSCAVVSGGGSACWGDDVGEQIGNGPGGTPVLQPHQHTLGGVSAVAAGTSFACALTDAGQHLSCWGDNKTQQIGESTQVNEPLPVQLL